MDVKDLRRGDVVIALEHLDPRGADVRPGTMGVVFDELNAYGDSGGPVVRWMNMGVCNVYQGQVARIHDPDRLEVINTSTGEIVGRL